MYISTYIYMYIDVHIYAYLYELEKDHVFRVYDNITVHWNHTRLTCISLRIYVCVYLCIYICIYVCIFI
jgi:hypothetical protein